MAKDDPNVTPTTPCRALLLEVEVTSSAAWLGRLSCLQRGSIWRSQTYVVRWKQSITTQVRG
jgi:hypothetical protein